MTLDLLSAWQLLQVRHRNPEKIMEGGHRRDINQSEFPSACQPGRKLCNKKKQMAIQVVKHPQHGKTWSECIYIAEDMQKRTFETLMQSAGS